MNLRRLLSLELLAAGILIFIKFALNLRKIKKAKYIFINSNSFGHSVLDSIAFIETFGVDSLVISLGTEFNHVVGTERNRYFDLCLDKNLIGIYFPELSKKKNNWKFVHPLSKRILELVRKAMNCPQIQFYEDKKFVLEDVVPKKISRALNCSLDEGKKIYKNLDICLVEGRFHFHPAGCIPIFTESKQIDLSSVNSKIERKFLQNLESWFQHKPFVCLAIRRGKTPWHSNADYYLELIDLLYSLGFEVALIGDREYIYEIVEKKNFSGHDKIYNLYIDKYQQKYFELFAIKNCTFVVGDQGGVWSLVHAFNKPGLQINTSPVATLQYNVEVLPRKWIYRDSGVEMLDANMVFNDLFFKWRFNSIVNKSHGDRVINSSFIGESNQLTPVENDKSFILSVVKRYACDLTYLTPLSMPKIITMNFPKNDYLRLAKNSSFSKEYLDRLIGLKNT
jgi:hypothetical protein